MVTCWAWHRCIEEEPGRTMLVSVCLLEVAHHCLFAWQILGWHTKMVLLVATQIQLQSVAVYCVHLDSFSSKRQYASNTFTSSLRNTQTFQKNTKILLFLPLLLALTSRQTALISTPLAAPLLLGVCVYLFTLFLFDCLALESKTICFVYESNWMSFIHFIFTLLCSRHTSA